MIIGLVGTLASGKGTVVEYLKTKGYAHYSSSGVLKEILDAKGLPHTRENLANAAEELLSRYKGGVLELNLERAQQAGATNVVLEAIHRMSEADFIRSRGGKIWAIDADVEVRYHRVTARKEKGKDDVSFEQFKSDMEREENGNGGTTNNIREVIKTADVVIMNNGTKQDLDKEIEAALWN